MEIFFFWFFFWFACTALTTIVASSKGRSGFGWFFLGFFFGIFALVAVALMPSIKAESTDGSYEYHDGISRKKYIPFDPSSKACPFCAELIKVEAIKCKHCQSDLTQPAPAA
jgi:hypothetical protein